MKLTTFSKSRTKFDNSSPFPTLGDKRRNSLVAFSFSSLQLSENKRNVLNASFSFSKSLNVEIADPFNSRLNQSDLTAIVVFRGETLVTENVESLLEFATQIKTSLQREDIAGNNINKENHAK